MSASSIDPISGQTISTGQVPFTASGSTSATDKVTEAETASISSSEKISTQQLIHDKAFFISILNMVFKAARSKLSLGLYPEAQELLRQYFLYLHGAGYYWSDFQTQTYGIHRYSAIFWTALVTEHIQGSKAQQAFTNKELLDDINQTLKNTEMSKQEHLQIQQFVHNLQSLGKLPTLERKNIVPEYATLVKLAKFFRSHHLNEAAQRMLLHAWVQQSLNLNALQHGLNAYSKPTSVRGGLFPLASHLFPFERTGLPYTTAIPYLQDARSKSSKEAQTVGLNYYTHNIHRVQPIDKDPNEDDKRRQRERQAQNAIDSDTELKDGH